MVGLFKVFFFFKNIILRTWIRALLIKDYTVIIYTSVSIRKLPTSNKVFMPYLVVIKL